MARQILGRRRRRHRGPNLLDQVEFLDYQRKEIFLQTLVKEICRRGGERPLVTVVDASPASPGDSATCIGRMCGGSPVSDAEIFSQLEEGRDRSDSESSSSSEDEEEKLISSNSKKKKKKQRESEKPPIPHPKTPYASVLFEDTPEETVRKTRNCVLKTRNCVLKTGFSDSERVYENKVRMGCCGGRTIRIKSSRPRSCRKRRRR